MADLQELQKQLNNIEELLALLIHVSDEKVPQLKNDINSIVKNIKDGFDKEELAKQIRTVLNQVINQSNYAKLQENIDTATRKMVEAVETSSYRVERLKSNSSWIFALVSGAICFVIGAGLMWSWQYSRIDKYQDAINRTDSMANYINSDCKLKKGYGKFSNQDIDCSQHWSSPSELLERK